MKNSIDKTSPEYKAGLDDALKQMRSIVEFLSGDTDNFVLTKAGLIRLISATHATMTKDLEES